MSYLYLVRDEIQMKTYETPGHDWSACCFQINNCLFTGDFLFASTQSGNDFSKK